MQKLIARLAEEVELRLLRSSEVARFEGIVLADMGSRKDQTTQFVDILLAALHLLKETDPRRFERVRRRLAWIVYFPLARDSAEYRHGTRTCAIDFVEPSSEHDSDGLVGWYASILVHEATHGEIRTRGILYTRELRSRIERLCVREEQRFVARLASTHPDLSARLHREFDPSRWEWHWNTTPTQRSWAGIKRAFRRDR